MGHYIDRCITSTSGSRGHNHVCHGRSFILLTFYSGGVTNLHSESESNKSESHCYPQTAK